MTDQEILAIAHRTAAVYRHRSDPNFPSYGFLNHTIIDFARRIEKAALERAAEVCEELSIAEECATAIRALKDVE